MVLTVAQTTAFFTDEDQMGIPALTYAQMQVEGIQAVGDLADFDKDTLEQLANNLRRPAGRVPNPDGGGGTITTPGFVFGAKSHKRLLVACDLVRYYIATGRAPTAGNMQWTNVIKNFEIQWRALKEKKKLEPTETPKITKALPIMKWTEVFPDFLNQVVGLRYIPLSYVIREVVAVPAASPTLAHQQPHSTEHGSVEAEMIARASHDHALYRDDNAKVYFYLEEATRSTTYAASIKPFQRGKDGRGAWFALINQYAGVDKWEAEIKRQEQLLHTRRWKGQSNFSLEGFVSQHRNAFVSMQACAEHVQYQLPNEHSRVGFILDAIECSDAGLQAAMASVRTDNGATGKRNNFEAAVAHMIPYDPVAKKRTDTSKKGRASLASLDGSESEVADVSAKKASIGKTGVHLRYYKQKEYQQLTPEQKTELREWREGKESKKRKGVEKKKETKKGKKLTTTNVSSVFDELFEARMQKEKDVTFKLPPPPQPPTQPTTQAAAVTATTGSQFTLKSILKNKKN